MTLPHRKKLSRYSCFVTSRKKIKKKNSNPLNTAFKQQSAFDFIEAGSLFSKVSHLCTISAISNLADPLP